MVNIQKRPDIYEKLSVLTQDSQYDLACACGTSDKNDHRHHTADGKWIYPIALPDGRDTYLFKTLISNVCTNNCKYCPLRVNQDTRRCSIEPEELIKVFLDYYRSGKVMGIFLSSGNIENPDKSMEKINETAFLLRKRNDFNGYIHLKIIPGSSNAAIEEAVSLSNAVSLNIETAGEKNFNEMCSSKNYLQDIIQPIKFISQLTQKGSPFSRVKQTTQFIVGASKEKDEEIVEYCWGMYKKLGLHRIYFGAYQKGLGEKDLPGEQSRANNNDVVIREHRLYQVDWLFRKYGFNEKDILFDQNGNLPLSLDPKENWAKNHPEYFPIDINKANYYTLLRVPGLGHLTVNKIINMQRAGLKIKAIEDLGRITKLIKKAKEYLIF